MDHWNPCVWKRRPWWGGAQAQDLHDLWRLFAGMGLRPGTCTARGVSSPGTPTGLPGPEQMGDPTLKGMWACIDVWPYHCTRRPGWQAGRSATVVAHALYITVQWCLTSVVSWSSSANLSGGEGPPLPPTVVLSLGPFPKPLFSSPGDTQLRLKCPGL